MVKAIQNKTEYRVTLVPDESISQFQPSMHSIVEAPTYLPEVDEPAFEKAWQKVRLKRTLGEVEPIPKSRAGCIQLRGSRKQQSTR